MKSSLVKTLALSSLISLSLGNAYASDSATTSTTSNSATVSTDTDNIPKRDDGFKDPSKNQPDDANHSIYNQYYNFLQFNLMQSYKARLPYNAQNDTYFEMEFGGRSGIIDLYGYLDVFDVFHQENDDRYNGDNMFFKIQPRFSINGIFDKDLSVGPVKEWFVATLAEVGDRELFNTYIGPGTNIEVPFLGLIGVNLMARYVFENYGAPNQNTWDGYKLSTNWFTPFYTFENGSFISYQGYLDWTFGMNQYDYSRSSYALEWFNGIYWHSRHFSAGYGLKYFANMTGMKNGVTVNGVYQNTTGWGNYFSVSYVFS